MSPLRYFAYGSNLDADQMRARCPSSRPLVRARLTHHRLGFTYFSTRWDGGAADVIPDSEDEVWGAVYELDERDLGLLDGFERGYDRVHLEVRGDGGDLYRTTSYCVRSKRDFAPHRVYVEKMLSWGERWRLPPGYLARLRRLL